jgi:hypothetical protein
MSKFFRLLNDIMKLKTGQYKILPKLKYSIEVKENEPFKWGHTLVHIGCIKNGELYEINTSTKMNLISYPFIWTKLDNYYLIESSIDNIKKYN